MECEKLQNLIDKIKTQFCKNNSSLYEPFIRHIRFPKYKRLKTDSIINFTYPLTILVGANGTNKTSILQALYGAPDQYSVGNYWFATDVDKIDEKQRHGFIYGYKHQKANKIVESLKIRIKNDRDPDYWEPARPQKRFNMDMPSKEELLSSGNVAETRWDLMKKKVVFADCKQYMSAFDLYFYHSQLVKTKTFNTKQDYLRYHSKRLSNVINQKLLRYPLRESRPNKVKRNLVLSCEECKWISFILGKSYDEIIIVEHAFFSKSNSVDPAVTVKLKQTGLDYTEAFAGSGEFRTVLIVHDILSAQENSLILMDEPEISLHPSAIENLKLFLLEQIQKKHHQIVISTHSPTLVRALPKEAIKLLTLDSDYYVNISENVSDIEAFSSIGHINSEQKVIFVEDILSEHIVKFFLENFHETLLDAIQVRLLPGGANNIIANNIVSAVRESSLNKYFLLDGDQNHIANNSSLNHIKDEWIRNKKLVVDLIPEGENPNLKNIIKELTNTNINLFADTNNEQGKYNLQRKLLKYWQTNVFFLITLLQNKIFYLICQ